MYFPFCFSKGGREVFIIEVHSSVVPTATLTRIFIALSKLGIEENTQVEHHNYKVDVYYRGKDIGWPRERTFLRIYSPDILAATKLITALQQEDLRLDCQIVPLQAFYPASELRKKQEQ